MNLKIYVIIEAFTSAFIYLFNSIQVTILTEYKYIDIFPQLALRSCG